MGSESWGEMFWDAASYGIRGRSMKWENESRDLGYSELETQVTVMLTSISKCTTMALHEAQFSVSVWMFHIPTLFRPTFGITMAKEESSVLRQVPCDHDLKMNFLAKKLATELKYPRMRRTEPSPSLHVQISVHVIERTYQQRCQSYNMTRHRRKCRRITWFLSKSAMVVLVS